MEEKEIIVRLDAAEKRREVIMTDTQSTVLTIFVTTADTMFVTAA